MNAAEAPPFSSEGPPPVPVPAMPPLPPVAGVPPSPPPPDAPAAPPVSAPPLPASPSPPVPPPAVPPVAGVPPLAPPAPAVGCPPCAAPPEPPEAPPAPAVGWPPCAPPVPVTAPAIPPFAAPPCALCCPPDPLGPGFSSGVEPQARPRGRIEARTTQTRRVFMNPATEVETARALSIRIRSPLRLLGRRQKAELGRRARFEGPTRASARRARWKRCPRTPAQPSTLRVGTGACAQPKGPFSPASAARSSVAAEGVSTVSSPRATAVLESRSENPRRRSPRITGSLT